MEDELSGIPRNFDESKEAPPDGRMYPPHVGREEASNAVGVRSFRTRKHLNSYAENGAIEILDVLYGNPIRDPPVIDKPGADGRRVNDF